VQAEAVYKNVVKSAPVVPLLLNLFRHPPKTSGKWVLTNTRSLCNKVAEFELFVNTRNPDIICAVETWLHNNIPDSLFCQRQYNVVRCNRHSRGGSVALFLRNELNYTIIDILSEFSNLEIICVDVEFGSQSVRLIGYYRRGCYDADAISYTQTTFTCLQKLCSTDKVVFLLGDFNLPEIDWDYYIMVLIILFTTRL